MSGHLRLVSPWVRNAVSAEDRRAIVETIPDDAIVYIIAADSPAGPFYAQLRDDDRKFKGGTPAAAVNAALREHRETVVVDGHGYVREWTR